MLLDILTTPTANATEVNKNIPAGTEPIIGPAAFKIPALNISHGSVDPELIIPITIKHVATGTIKNEITLIILFNERSNSERGF